MKVKSKTYWKRKCDKAWSLRIRKRNKGLCEICGKPADNPHHTVGKKNLTLRYDLRNGCLLCSWHHTLSNRESAHGDPIWFIQWLIRNRPGDYTYLLQKREEITTYFDYALKLKELENE